MFDAVTRRWQQVGNVHLIAGPDLAAITVEPHEFLNFLSGHMTNAFIADRTIDVEFMQQVVDDAWAALAADSPNRASQDPTLAVVALESVNEDSLRRLLRTLSSATTDRQSP